MQLYQFIIFIIIFVILLTVFGFRLLKIAEENLKKLKINDSPKSSNNIVENFNSYPDAKLNADVTLPDEFKYKKAPNQYPDVDIQMSKPLPGDDMEYLDKDKIYINPFFPDENPKEKPNQNYANPEDMTSTERNAFKYGYPNGMTMQDYVNWLYLFRLTPDLLNLDHNANYQKLIKNVPIKYEKGKTPPPAKRMPPLNGEDYFLYMYTQNPTRPDPLFTQTIHEDVRVASVLGDPSNGIIPYNYAQFPDFSQTFNTMGISQNVYNNELAEKTDPYFLQKFIGPVMTVKEPKLSDM